MVTIRTRNYGLSHSVGRNVFDYLGPLTRLLGTPKGMFGAVAFFAMVLYAVSSRNGKKFLIFLATLTGMVGYYHSIYWNNTLIGPLETFRGFCKPLFVVAIALLAARYMRDRSGMPNGSLPAGAVAFITLELLFVLRVMFIAPERTAGALVLITMLFLGVLQYIRRSVWTPEDFISLLCACVTASLVFFGLSTIQLIFGPPDRIVINGRFTGLSDNPQHVAEAGACIFLMAAYVLTSGAASRGQRLLCLVGAAVLVPFMVWTGSRTGAGMTAVGLLVLNRAKFKRWVGLAILGAVSFKIYSYFSPAASAIASRLGSTADTRIKGWLIALSAFVRHPLFGRPGLTVITESSVLSVAAALGIVGLAVFAVMVLALFNDLSFVYRNRGRLDEEDRKMCEFICAFAAAFFAGSFFDAYLLAIATSAAVFMGMILAFTSIARAKINASLMEYNEPVDAYAAQEPPVLEAGIPALS